MTSQITWLSSKSKSCIHVCRHQGPPGTVSCPGGGGGGYSGFQVIGMIEWGQKSKPQKNPLTKIYPPPPPFQEKSHAQFPSHKHFQKALNDITRQNGNIGFEYPPNPYLNQVTQKNTCQNCPHWKNPQILYICDFFTNVYSLCSQ